MAVALLKTSQFLEDYRQIILGIADVNPDAADRICDAVENALTLISRHPQIAPLARFPKVPNVRRWVLRPFNNYLLYYEEQGEQVVVLRLLHGARHQARLIEG